MASTPYGVVERVTIEHNESTSWIAEHRTCGCIIAWGPMLRIWLDRECDTHRAEKETRKAARRWWKWSVA